MVRSIAVVLAPGFEEIEALAVVDVLRRAELPVTIAALGTLAVEGAHGISVGADCLLEELAQESVSAVVLPGGMPGAVNLAESDRVGRLVRAVWERGELVAAICAAPIALAAAGILDGRAVTCYPGFEGNLGAANYTGSRVEEDGMLVTACGPGAAIEFALRLVTKLASAEQAQALAAAMQVA